MDKWLNRISALLIILVASTVLYAQFHKPKPGSAKAYTPGTQVDVTKLGLRQKTLFVVVRSECGFCKASIPLYQQLSARQGDLETVTAPIQPMDIIAVIAGEPLEKGRQFLTDAHIKVDRVITLEQSGLSVRGTPALILVRQNGVVIDSWLGHNPHPEKIPFQVYHKG